MAGVSRLMSKGIPDGAEVVTTYAALAKEFVEPYFKGNYNLLIVVGRPGLSKSWSFKERKNSVVIQGKTTPIRAYILAYKHQGKALIFDDAELMWDDKNGRALLRQLCDSTETRLIQWESSSSVLDNEGIPRSFRTNSKIAIVCNRLDFGKEHETDALIDRGHLVYFDPPPEEIHKMVGKWFKDKVIYEHIGAKLKVMNKLSARTYKTTLERKNAGGDWRKYIEEVFCHKSTVLLVQDLENDSSLQTATHKVNEFIRRGAGSRATYYNLKKELLKNGQI